jgi:hypothetical protein
LKTKVIMTRQRLDQRLQAVLQRLREDPGVQTELMKLPPEARAAHLAALAVAELRHDREWAALVAQVAEG